MYLHYLSTCCTLKISCKNLFDRNKVGGKKQTNKVKWPELAD